MKRAEKAGETDKAVTSPVVDAIRDLRRINFTWVSRKHKPSSSQIY